MTRNLTIKVGMHLPHLLVITKSIPNPVQLEVGHSKRLAHEMMSRRWILRQPTLCEVLTQITQTDALNE